MKHALRKYLSPCGSALFMVVSTMAALTVLVTAMYMSVLSSRQVQYATFDQEQAYVTSTSVADIFTAYISDSKNASTTIMKKIGTMKAGQTITTNGNDFAAFGGTKEDSAIGAYTVDIKRLNNETISGVDWNVYDIAVTVQKNGIERPRIRWFVPRMANPRRWSLSTDSLPVQDTFLTMCGSPLSRQILRFTAIMSTPYSPRIRTLPAMAM